MIAIHYQEGNFYCKRWKWYCDHHKIPYKLVSCYDNNIMEQLRDCSGLLWHVNNLDHRDQLLAKNLINALENTKIKLFPDSRSVWHFDDKAAQKYLFESIKAPLVPSYVFYTKRSALEWLSTTQFPKVFKLSKGGAAVNVKLVKSYSKAKSLVNKAFGKGFPVLDMTSIFWDRVRKFKRRQESFLGVLKGLVRLVIKTPFVRMSSREKGFIYFQDFLPNNDFDQRITVIGERAVFGKRMNRTNDFRASGSGKIIYDKDDIDTECVNIAFEVSKKLQLQSAAYDFIYDQRGRPKIVEVSFCADPNREYYQDLGGYWDSKLQWHESEGEIWTEDWIIQDLINEINNHN